MTDSRIKQVDCVVGARPNFVKMAPIIRAIGGRDRLATRLIHTGQHYDVSMNAVFFKELSIPDPDVNLEVGSGTGTEQTARVMLGLEPLVAKARPDIMLVVGDVNSTVAAALVASKNGVPLAHVEAGLRSNDRTMPEEINRLVTDRLADLLLTTEHAASKNLIAEGVERKRIKFVGNVMIDTLFSCLDRAPTPSETLIELGATSGFARRALTDGFAFVTLHRPSNVDDPQKLGPLLGALAEMGKKLPIVFPIHPRTRGMIVSLGFEWLANDPGMLVTTPLSYLRTIGLMRAAKLVVTDSGGIQEETTALGTPCLTVRENTERPITIDEGTNTLVGSSPAAVLKAFENVLATGGKMGRVPELWDGKAAERIADELEIFLGLRASGADDV